jgi:hypothetical protein
VGSGEWGVKSEERREESDIRLGFGFHRHGALTVLQKTIYLGI